MTDVDAAVFAASLEIIKAHPMAIKASSLRSSSPIVVAGSDCGGGRDKLSFIHPRARQFRVLNGRIVVRTIDERTEGEGVTRPPGEWQRVLANISDRMEHNHRNSHMGTGRQF